MRFEGISKKFADKAVLENFTAEVPENKVTCIVGQSGSGKTTLFNIALGLQKADCGSVSFEKTPIFSAVFQEDRLFMTKTAPENVMFSGCDKNEAVRLLEAVGLGAELNSLPSSLSGGMNRRLALARALARPNYTHLFLDEPFTAQDEKTRALLTELIKKETVGKTVVLITHFPDDVKNLADNVIAL